MPPSGSASGGSPRLGPDRRAGDGRCVSPSRRDGPGADRRARRVGRAAAACLSPDHGRGPTARRPRPPESVHDRRCDSLCDGAGDSSRRSSLDPELGTDSRRARAGVTSSDAASPTRHATPAADGPARLQSAEVQSVPTRERQSTGSLARDCRRLARHEWRETGAQTGVIGLCASIAGQFDLRSSRPVEIAR